jgi:hypothetical protein
VNLYKIVGNVKERDGTFKKKKKKKERERERDENIMELGSSCLLEIAKTSNSELY